MPFQFINNWPNIMLENIKAKFLPEFQYNYFLTHNEKMSVLKTSRHFSSQCLTIFVLRGMDIMDYEARFFGY